MKEYTLKINENQANVIKTALEEYFRIRMNQWRDLAEDLASVDFVYDKSNPNNDKNFNEYLLRRDISHNLFRTAMEIAQPRRHFSNTLERSEKSLIAQDIWQVIRNRLYLDNGGDPNGWCVDARPPLPVSDEPLPMMDLETK